MPKVIRSGVFFSEELDFPRIIPEKIKAQCHNCFAELETEKEEQGELVKRKSKKNGIYELGWRITCPECKKKVFFPYQKMTRDLLIKINGWG